MTGRISLSAMTSAGTGIIAIGGLPFTVLAGQAGYAAGAVSFKVGWATQGPEYCYAEPSTNLLQLSYQTATSTVLMTPANLTAAADVIFSCAYRTSA